MFALMGLRQLYFLLGDLLKRLVFLSQGLAILLAFIGVKLVLHALHENEVPFINGGEHVHGAGDLDAAQPRRHRRDAGDHGRRRASTRRGPSTPTDTLKPPGQTRKGDVSHRRPCILTA